MMQSHGGAQYIPGTGSLKITRTDQDLIITKPGIYIFFGNTIRTFTFSDDVKGEVVIFNEATVKLNVAGAIDSNFAGMIWPGNPSMIFRWSIPSNKYIF